MFDNKFWEEVKSNSPKSWNKFIFWCNNNFEDFIHQESFDFICYCDIEKFFDENSIKIFFDMDKETNFFEYEIVILLKNRLYNHNYSGYKFSYIKAKFEAVKKAFEILENKSKPTFRLLFQSSWRTIINR